MLSTENQYSPAGPRNFAAHYRLVNNMSQFEAGALLGISGQAFGQKERMKAPLTVEDIRTLCAAWVDERGNKLTPNRLVYGPAYKEAV